jgi:hypothetical protein
MYLSIALMLLTFATGIAGIVAIVATSTLSKLRLPIFRFSLAATPRSRQGHYHRRIWNQRY